MLFCGFIFFCKCLPFIFLLNQKRDMLINNVYTFKRKTWGKTHTTSPKTTATVTAPQKKILGSFKKPSQSLHPLPEFFCRSNVSTMKSQSSKIQIASRSTSRCYLTLLKGWNGVKTRPVDRDLQWEVTQQVHKTIKIMYLQNTLKTPTTWHAFFVNESCSPAGNSGSFLCFHCKASFDFWGA